MNRHIKSLYPWARNYDKGGPIKRQNLLAGMKTPEQVAAETMSVAENTKTQSSTDATEQRLQANKAQKERMQQQLSRQNAEIKPQNENPLHYASTNPLTQQIANLGYTNEQNPQTWYRPGYDYQQQYFSPETREQAKNDMSNFTSLLFGAAFPEMLPFLAAYSGNELFNDDEQSKQDVNAAINIAGFFTGGTHSVRDLFNRGKNVAKNTVEQVKLAKNFKPRQIAKEGDFVFEPFRGQDENLIGSVFYNKRDLQHKSGSKYGQKNILGRSLERVLRGGVKSDVYVEKSLMDQANLPDVKLNPLKKINHGFKSTFGKDANPKDYYRVSTEQLLTSKIPINTTGQSVYDDISNQIVSQLKTKASKQTVPVFYNPKTSKSPGSVLRWGLYGLPAAVALETAFNTTSSNIGQWQDYKDMRDRLQDTDYADFQALYYDLPQQDRDNISLIVSNYINNPYELENKQQFDMLVNAFEQQYGEKGLQMLNAYVKYQTPDYSNPTQMHLIDATKSFVNDHVYPLETNKDEDNAYAKGGPKKRTVINPEWDAFQNRLKQGNVAENIAASRGEYWDRNWYDPNYKSGLYSFDDSGVLTYQGQTYAPFGNPEKGGIAVPVRTPHGISYGANVVYYPIEVPQQYIEEEYYEPEPEPEPAVITSPVSAGPKTNDVVQRNRQTIPSRKSRTSTSTAKTTQNTRPLVYSIKHNPYKDEFVNGDLLSSMWKEYEKRYNENTLTEDYKKQFGKSSSLLFDYEKKRNLYMAPDSISPIKRTGWIHNREEYNKLNKGFSNYAPGASQKISRGWLGRFNYIERYSPQMDRTDILTFNPNTGELKITKGAFQTRYTNRPKKEYVGAKYIITPKAAFNETKEAVKDGWDNIKYGAEKLFSGKNPFGSNKTQNNKTQTTTWGNATGLAYGGPIFAKGGYKAYSKTADKLNEEYGIDMSMSKKAFRQNRKNAWAGLEQSQRVAEQLASQTPYQMTPSERVENYIEGNNIPVDAGNYVYNYRQAKQRDAYNDYVSYISQLANPTAASFANRVAERPDYRGIADLELALATAVDPYMLLSDGVGPTVQSVANYVSKKLPKINVSNLRRIVPTVEKQYEALSNLKGTAAADKIFQMTNKPIPGGASPRHSIIDYFPSTDNLSSLSYFDMSPFEVKKRAFKDLKRIKVGGMFTETNLSTDSYPLVLNMMQTKHTPNFEIIPTGHMTRLNTHGKLAGDAAVNRINKKIMLLNADRGMSLPMAKYIPASSPESIQNALRLNTDAILQEGHAYNSPLPIEELHFSDEYWVPELFAKRLYQKGGSIHIKPENRGKFTAAANRAGKSVQAYASQILANKDHYSTTLVKRANFARVFGKKK